MSKINDFQTLRTAAEAYLALGYAVIPLLGDHDPARPKVAACSWGVYQQRLPAPADTLAWFAPDGIGAALGIVTGSPSHLAVLDFDSADAFSDFSRRYPDLLETHTVRSAGRGLPHLYFRLPPHLRLASHKVVGVDLLSDGRYVVAPPSTINGQAYKIVRGGMPRSLTERDIQRLQTFMRTVNNPTPLFRNASPALADMPQPASPVKSTFKPAQPLPLVVEIPAQAAVTRKKLTRADLHGLYTYWRSKGGRNEALFRTALHARDHGWNEGQTRRVLSQLHVYQPASPPASHAETPLIRQREAEATIHSAFSRPPRSQTRAHQPNAIANSAREWLMQHKMTCVIRTLEGLMQTGYHAGQVFTAEQAVQTLKGLVGRDSVYKALNALAANGKPIFRRKSPSALPPASNEAAKSTKRLKTKKCFFVTQQKSGLISKGPKQRLYILPSNRDLCRLLGVKTTGSDPLTRSDLASARQTRMGLHRELIKRRHGEYTRGWLAGRLGVSRRTLDAYNQLIPIHRRATYITTSLAWATIERLPLDEPLAGAFIETLVGKRYPALRTIASYLLAKGTFIRLQQRAGNYYWYGSDEPPDVTARAVTPAPEPAQQSPVRQPPAPRPSPTRRAQAAAPPKPARDASPRRFRSPLSRADHETLAQQVYTRVNQRSTDSTRQLSLSNARKLVNTYGGQQVTQALALFERRSQLDNPTGYFVSVLTSNARQQARESKKGKA